MKKSKKIILSILSILIILLFILEIFYNKELTNFDLKISNYIWSYRNDKLTSIMKFLSFLGGSKFIILMLCILFIFNKNYLIVLNLSISTIINHVLKKLFNRDRPLNILVKESSKSFPSGHASASTSFYGYLIYLLYKKDINNILKVSLISLLVLLVLLISFSRVYLGAHYISDVVTGILVSTLYLNIFIYYIEK